MPKYTKNADGILDAVGSRLEEAIERIDTLERALLDTEAALAHTEAQLATARKERDKYQAAAANLKPWVNLSDLKED